MKDWDTLVSLQYLMPLGWCVLDLFRVLTLLTIWLHQWLCNENVTMIFNQGLLFQCLNVSAISADVALGYITGRAPDWDPRIADLLFLYSRIWFYFCRTIGQNIKLSFYCWNPVPRIWIGWLLRRFALLTSSPLVIRQVLAFLPTLDSFPVTNHLSSHT